MAVAAEQTASKAPTYGNWQKPTSAGLGKLGTLGTAILLGGLMILILVLATNGLLAGLGVGVVLGLVLLGITRRDVHGRSVIEKIMTRFAWFKATNAGTHLYRSGPLGFALWGTHQLPGIAASLKLSEFRDSYGRPFAMVYAPATDSYAVVFSADPDGASLVDQGQVDVWVRDWGNWLSGLADDPGLLGCSVTLETTVDTSDRVGREVERNIDPQAPAFAQRMLREAALHYPLGASQTNAYVTVTFSANPHGSKRRTAEEMGRDLATRIPGYTATLGATGAGAARPLSASELREVIRVAYDPACAKTLDEARSRGEEVDLHWSDVGPAAAEATWDGYYHDSAFSRTWTMSVAPRGNVSSSILARLLAPAQSVPRKRVTLLYRPIDSARAANIVDSDQLNAEFTASSSKRPTARSVRAVKAAAATAAEEATGAGLVNFAVVITGSIDRDGDRDQMSVDIENLAGSARLKIRPAYGAQPAAFAAGLPLGLIMPKHSKLPESVRGRL